MKRFISLAFLTALGLALVGCASPRNASITNGNISNITSAEAVTLVKRDQRQTKVASVMTNQKPLVYLKAHAGKAITIDAEEFAVYAPLDLDVLLSEEADAVSENVQMAGIVKDGLKDVAVPIALGALLVNDRKNSSNNAAKVEVARAADRTAQSQAMADIAGEGMTHASKPPLVVTMPASTIVQVPLGSSILEPATVAPSE
jgi:hypothetical protein